MADSVVKDEEEGDLEQRDNQDTKQEDKTFDFRGKTESFCVSFKLVFEENSFHFIFFLIDFSFITGEFSGFKSDQKIVGDKDHWHHDCRSQ